MNTLSFRSRCDLEEVLATVPAEQPLVLIGYLASKYKERNDLAAEVFLRVGAAAVPILVREAVLRGKRPQHRIRLLDLIARIGTPLGVDEWMTLFSGTGMYKGEVRKKIVEVLVRLGRATSPAPQPAASSTA